jgi:hypothetical protein
MIHFMDDQTPCDRIQRYGRHANINTIQPTAYCGALSDVLHIKWLASVCARDICLKCRKAIIRRRGKGEIDE